MHLVAHDTTFRERMLSLDQDDSWQYECWPEDYNLHETVKRGIVKTTRLGEPVYDFSISIRFPVSDIDLITDHLERLPHIDPKLAEELL